MTVTDRVAADPDAATVIVVLPTASAVIFPEEETFATDALALLKVTGASEVTFNLLVSFFPSVSFVFASFSPVLVTCTDVVDFAFPLVELFGSGVALDALSANTLTQTLLYPREDVSYHLNLAEEALLSKEVYR